jgi:hypothetical protein
MSNLSTMYIDELCVAAIFLGSTSNLFRVGSLVLCHHVLNQILSVRGIVNLSDSTVILKPSMILPSSSFTTRPIENHFAIHLLDEKGRVLADYPVDIRVSRAKILGSTENKDGHTNP